MSYSLDFCVSLKPGKRRTHFGAKTLPFRRKKLALIIVIKDILY
jgi:hypothetical protein